MCGEVARGTQMAQEGAAANLEDLQLASFPGSAHSFFCVVL